MTDEKNPADRALELFLFAPLGFALSARDLLPQLVERGRQQVNGQVNLARMIGQMAVKQGTIEAEKAFERARTSAQATLEQLGILGEEQRAAPATTAGARASAAVVEDRPPAAPAAPEAVTAPEPAAPEAAAAGSAAGGGGAELAIPDYDSLSASQVLPRLSALTPPELEAVRDHESTHRGRKTILSKVAQLQAS